VFFFFFWETNLFKFILSTSVEADLQNHRERNKKLLLH